MENCSALATDSLSGLKTSRDSSSHLDLFESMVVFELLFLLLARRVDPLFDFPRPPCVDPLQAPRPSAVVCERAIGGAAGDG